MKCNYNFKQAKCFKNNANKGIGKSTISVVLFILFMYRTMFMYVNMCNTCASGALRGQKRRWDFLEVEL